MVLLSCARNSALVPDRLPLPESRGTVAGGSALAKILSELTPDEREEEILEYVKDGKMPSFLAMLQRVTVRETVGGSERELTFFVAPDYFALGSDEDYFLCPLTPATAQEIADSLACLLPTRKIVDAIYAQATVKLEPAPIAPSERMTTVPVFWQHNMTVWHQRQATLALYPLGTLVAGHKKDLVITPKLAKKPTSVAIYGWHRTDGNPIQPLYLGHSSSYADYSHGIRLVSRRALLDQRPVDLLDVLRDKDLCILISDEGPVSEPRCPARQADGPK